MIDDENDPRMIAEAQELLKRVTMLIQRRGLEMTRGFFQDLRGVCYDHRVVARSHGVNFPKLTFLVCPRLGGVSMVRADLEEAGIKGAAVVLARENPGITATEIYAAIKFAFPDRPNKPFDLADQGVEIATAVPQGSA